MVRKLRKLCCVSLAILCTLTNTTAYAAETLSVTEQIIAETPELVSETETGDSVNFLRDEINENSDVTVSYVDDDTNASDPVVSDPMVSDLNDSDPVVSDTNNDANNSVVVIQETQETTVSVSVTQEPVQTDTNNNQTQQTDNNQNTNTSSQENTGSQENELPKEPIYIEKTATNTISGHRIAVTGQIPENVEFVITEVANIDPVLVVDGLDFNVEAGFEVALQDEKGQVWTDNRTETQKTPYTVIVSPDSDKDMELCKVYDLTQKKYIDYTYNTDVQFNTSQLGSFTFGYTAKYKMVQQTLSKTIDKYVVTAEGNMPENAKLSVKEVFNYTELEEKIGEENYKIEVAFDIEILVDGQPWQPMTENETLKVSVNNLESADPDIQEITPLEVYRIYDEDDIADIVENTDATHVEEVTQLETEVDNKTGEVSVESDHFTIYTFGTVEVDSDTDAYLAPGWRFNMSIKQLVNSSVNSQDNPDTTITSIEWVSTPFTSSCRLDYAATYGTYPTAAVYARLNGTKVELYTTANRVFLNNSNSGAMFKNFKSLQSVDLSKFDSSSANTGYELFTGCSSLTSIDFSQGNWDTSNMTGMTSMFNGCSSLTSINLGSNFNTANVTSTAYMFQYCSSLTSINVGNHFDLSSSENMRAMFDGCSSLQTLNLGTGFRAAAVSNTEFMFQNCSSLRALDLGNNFNTSHATTMRNMFNNCTSLESLNLGSSFTVAATDNISLMFAGVGSTAANTLSLTLPGSFNASSVTSVSDVFNGAAFGTLNLGDNFNISSATDLSTLFGTMTATSIDLGANFNARSATSVNTMFKNVTVTNLDLGDNFNLASATNTNAMFSYSDGPKNIEVLDLGNNFGGANIATMSEMFSGTHAAITLGNGFYTDSCENMGGMFYGLTMGGTLDLGDHFDTSNVVNMHAMFGDSPWITGINLGDNFDTSNVTDTGYMFGGCLRITSLDLGDHFNTSKVTNMSTMFCDMGQLLTLDLGDVFYTPLVTNFSSMFAGCTKLTSLNMSPMTIQSGANTSTIFSDMNSITVIYAPKTIASDQEITLQSKLGNRWFLDDDDDGEPDSLVTYYTSFINGVTNESHKYIHGEYSGKTATLTYGQAFNVAIKNLADNGRTYTDDAFVVATDESGTGFKENTVTDIRWSETAFTSDVNLSSEGVPVYAKKTIEDGKVIIELYTEASTVYFHRNCDCMFSGLIGLETISFLSTKINTTNVEVFNSMFGNFYRLDTTLPDENGMYAGYALDGHISTLDLSRFDTRSATNMDSMFQCCTGITTLDLSGFNTDNVTSFRYMFYKCQSLTSLDFSTFNTGNVLTMESMFNTCQSLTSITNMNFDTSKVTDMSFMFNDCASLATINVSGFNTANVTNMSSMFQYCQAVTALDLSHFNTEKVTNMSYMFNRCLVLESLNLSSFDTSNVINMERMFQLCKEVSTFNLTNFNTANVQNMEAMFFCCENAESINVSSFNTSQVTSMASMFSRCYALTQLDISNFDIQNVTNVGYMLANCNVLLRVKSPAVILESQTINLPSVSSKYWYLDDNEDLTADSRTKYQYMITPANQAHIYVRTDTIGLEIPGGLYARFITGPNVRVSITSIAPTATEIRWTNDETELWSLNERAAVLSTDDGEQILATSDGSLVLLYTIADKVYLNADSSEMFAEMTSLATIPFLNDTRIDTSEVTDMQAMFYKCSKIQTLDLRNFITDNVTDMSYMFDDCNKLQTVNLSSFNTENVTDMSYMFTLCNSLTSLDVTNFDTRNVTDMFGMFQSCQNITSIDVSNFDVSKVTNAGAIFTYCNKLTSLDLSTWELDSCTTCNGMLSSCSKLTEFYSPIASNSQKISFPIQRPKCSWIQDDDKNSLPDPEASHTGYTAVDPSTDGSHRYIYPDYTVVSNGRFFNKTIKQLINSNATEITEDNTITQIRWNIVNPNNMPVSMNTVSTAGHQIIPSYENGVITLTTDTTDIRMMMNTECMFYNFNALETTDFFDYVNSSYLGTIEDCSAAWMFYGCNSLQSIDLTGLHTENINNMRSMFYHCEALTALNLTNFRTNNVSSMLHMFNGCNGLTSLDVSSFNTQKVTDMSCMFNGCSGLTTLNLSNFNAQNVTDMSSMLGHCSSLTEVTFGNLNTINVTTMNSMFYQCTSLEHINGINSFNTSNVTDLGWMFYDCPNLAEINVSHFNTENVTVIKSMFAGCKALTELDLSSFDISNVTTYAYILSNCNGLQTIIAPVTIIDGQNIALPSVTGKFWYLDDDRDLTTDSAIKYQTMINPADQAHVYIRSDLSGIVITGGRTATLITGPNFKSAINGISTTIKDIRLAEKGATPSSTAVNVATSDGEAVYAVLENHLLTDDVVMLYSDADIIYLNADSHNMFYEMSNLTACSFIGDERIDTSNVTDMALMFDECSGLTAIDTNRFNTANVTRMRGLFANCSKITSLDVSSFNTENVDDMVMMFYSCTELTTLNINGFDTSNVTDMRLLFSNCSKLTTIDVSGFDTQNVTSMQYMFNNCVGITELDLSNFDTSNVTNMASMFEGCSNLTGLDVSNFNTSNVTDMSFMFSNCNTITGLDVSNFNVANAETISYMFQATKKLQTLNLSTWSLSSVTNTTDCLKLSGIKEIYTPLTGNNQNLILPVKTGEWWIWDDNQDGVPDTGHKFSAYDGVNETTNRDGYGGHRFILPDYAILRPGQTFNAYIKQLVNSEATYQTADTSIKEIKWRFVDEIDTSTTGKSVSVGGKNIWATYENGIVSLETNANEIWMVYAPSYTFYELEALEETDFFEHLNSNHMNTDSAYGMFFNCRALKSLDLSNFDTKNINFCNDMFNSCISLTSLGDISTWDTSKVTAMAGMFRSCSSMTSIDVSHFNTSNVTTIRNMFNGCTSLQEINVSGFNTTNVTRMDYIFRDCANLESIDVTGFNVSKVTDISYMFYGCTKLSTIDLHTWSLSALITYNNVVHNSGIKEIYSPITSNSKNITLPRPKAHFWVLDDNKDGITDGYYGGYSSLMPDSTYAKDQGTHRYALNDFAVINSAGSSINQSLKKLINSSATYKDTTDTTIKQIKWNIVESTEGLSGTRISTVAVPIYATYADGVITLTTDTEDIRWVGATNTSYLFYKMEALEETEFFDKVDTSYLTGTVSGYGMFYNCKALKTLDLSQLHVEHLYSLESLFYNCNNLTDTGDISGWDTSNVLYMDYMFYGCNKLGTIDVSHFNTSKVKLMQFMFCNCVSATELDVDSFNTANVTNMSSMFEGCSNITSLDLSNFNTQKVTTMDFMFNKCAKLTTIDTSNFDTSQVTTMKCMFQNCNVATEIDVSSFNTLNVTTMEYMFNNCYAVTELDVSNFNTANVTTMLGMLLRCNNLKSIDVTGFDVSKVTDVSYMFYGCAKLSTLDASTWNLATVTNTSNILSASAVKEFYSPTASNSKPINLPYPTGYSWLQDDDKDGLPDNGTRTVGWTTLEPSTDGSHRYILPDYAVLYGGNVFNQRLKKLSDSSATYETIDTTIIKIQLNIVESIETTGTNITAGAPVYATISDGVVTLTTTTDDIKFIYSPYYMFYNMQALEEIEFFDKVNSSVQKTGLSAAYMFANCYSLQTVDLSDFKTDNIINMSYMFEKCSSLENIDLSNFNTENVTTMAYMFNGCTALESIDLSTLNTPNLINMHSMFNKCKSIKSINLRRFNTSKVTDMHATFSECNALTDLNISNFDMTKVTDAGAMFDMTNSSDPDETYALVKLVAPATIPEELEVSLPAQQGDTYWFLDDDQNESPDNDTHQTMFINNVAGKSHVYIRKEELKAYLLPGDEFNAQVKTLLTSYFYGNILWTDSAFDTSSSNAVVVSTDESPCPVYARYRQYNIELYSEASVIYLNEDSAGMFQAIFPETNNNTSAGNIDLSRVTASLCTDMSSMFADNIGLHTVIGLTTWNTDGVTNFSYMFDDCRKLVSIGDISEWDVSSSTNFAHMFDNCRALNSVGDFSQWDVSNSTDLSYMFDYCKDITTLDLSTWDISGATNVEHMIDNCSNLQMLKAPQTIGENQEIDLYTPQSSIYWYLDDDGNSESDDDIVYTSLINNVTNDSHTYRRSTDTRAIMLPGYMYNAAIQEIISTNTVTLIKWTTEPFDDSEANATTVSTASSPVPVYARVVNDTEIEMYSTATDIYLNEDASNMFRYFSSVTSIDTTKFNTSECEDMLQTFYGCTNLQTIDLTNWDVSRVTRLNWTFNNCQHLTNLGDISHWNLENCTDFYGTFQYCYDIETLNLSDWQTGQVTTAGNMFYSCQSLKNLDVTNWDISNITSWYQTFYNCKVLESVDLSNWDPQGARANFYYTFGGCTALTDVGDISNWDVSNAIINYMFYECAFTELDLSGWVMSETMPYPGVLQGLYNLQVFKAPKTIPEHVNLTAPWVSGHDYKWYLDDEEPYMEADNYDAYTSSIPFITGVTNESHTYIRDDVEGFVVLPQVAYLIPGTNFKNSLSTLVALNSITAIRWSETPFDDTTEGVIKISTDDTPFYVYARSNGTDIQLYTTALTVYVNPDASNMFDSMQILQYIDTSRFDTSLMEQCKEMFNNCKNLVSIDLSDWDMSHVTTMERMFYNCEKLEDIGEVSDWDLGQCTTLRYVFGFCNSMQTLDLSNWITTNVQDMYYAFYKCEMLENLAMTNWDISSVTSWYYTFSDCTALESLDLSNLDPKGAVANFYYTFNNCTSLNDVGDISHWDVSNATINNMFYNCAFEELDLSGWVMNSQTKYPNVISGLNDLKKFKAPKTIPDDVKIFAPSVSGYDYKWYMDDIAPFLEPDDDKVYSSSKAFIRGIVDESHTYIREDIAGFALPAELDNGFIINLKFKKFTNENVSLEGTSEEMRKRISDETDAELGFDGNDYTITNIKWADTAFNTEDEGVIDIASYDHFSSPIYARLVGTVVELYTPASKVYFNTHTSYIFRNFTALEYIDILKEVDGKPIMDTSQVENFSAWFYNDPALKELDVSHFNTSNAYSFWAMFYGCSTLTELDVSGFDTSNCTESMANMFGKCDKLQAIDVSGFDVSHTVSLSHMFYRCKELTTLDLSSFDTANATSMDTMFASCRKLATLTVNPAKFDTSNVTTMKNMFNDCQALPVSQLPTLDTSSVTDMEGMFKTCYAFDNLDISSFDISKVTTFTNMFNGCKNLVTLTMPDPEQNIAISSGMFAKCPKLATITGLTHVTSIVPGAFETTPTDTGLYRLLQFTDYENFISDCWLDYDWHADNRTTCIYYVSTPAMYDIEDTLDIGIASYIGVEDIIVESDASIELVDVTNSSQNMTVYIQASDIGINTSDLTEPVEIKPLAGESSNITYIEPYKEQDSNNAYYMQEEYGIKFLRDWQHLPEIGEYNGNLNLYFSTNLNAS